MTRDKFLNDQKFTCNGLFRNLLGTGKFPHLSTCLGWGDIIYKDYFVHRSVGNGDFALQHLCADQKQDLNVRVRKGKAGEVWGKIAFLAKRF